LRLETEFGDTPATLEANGSIVYDPKLRRWVMFALGFAPTLGTGDRVRIYRFTSADGMEWTRGDDGKPDWVRFDLTDVRSGRRATNTDVFSCWYDPSQPDRPYQGWLFFANWGDDLEGVHHVWSQDGRTWVRGRQVMDGYARAGDASSRQIRQGDRTLVGAGDVTLFSRDPVRNRFLALIKFASPTPVGPDNRLRARAYAYCDRLDQPFDLQQVTHVDLVPPAASVGGDAPGDEYYAATAWRYESLWLGGLKIWHGTGDHPYSAAGAAYLKLASSRDGLHWTKVPFSNEAGDPEVFLPNGREGGNQGTSDGGYLTEFSQGPLRLGKELIFYYGCSSWGKNHPRGIRVTGGGIFRARLRVDGFVSVHAGTFTTPPLRTTGTRLLVNSRGPAAVELLDRRDRVLGRAQLSGDAIDQPVRFAGRDFARTAAGGEWKLRFTVRPGGELYAFRVR
jgi:hypothetical protein